MKPGYVYKTSENKRANDAKYRRTEKGKIAQYKSNHNPKYKKLRIKAMTAYNKRIHATEQGIIKRKARYTINNLLKDGKISRRTCSVCGGINRIQAHHNDYNKPYDIIWLCEYHHKKLHKRLGGL